MTQASQPLTLSAIGLVESDEKEVSGLLRVEDEPIPRAWYDILNTDRARKLGFYVDSGYDPNKYFSVRKIKDNRLEGRISLFYMSGVNDYPWDATWQGQEMHTSSIRDKEALMRNLNCWLWVHQKYDEAVKEALPRLQEMMLMPGVEVHLYEKPVMAVNTATVASVHRPEHSVRISLSYLWRSTQLPCWQMDFARGGMRSSDTVARTYSEIDHAADDILSHLRLEYD